MPVEAGGVRGTEVAYEVGGLLWRAEHPEVAIVVEHAVELFADDLRPEAPGLFLHAGVDHTGVHADGRYVVRFALGGEDAGELVQGRLRGAVGCHSSHGMPGGGAGDVDDASPVTGDHLRQRLSGAEKGSRYVHLEHPAPCFRPRGGYGERYAGRAGVVDEDGSRSEPGTEPLEAFGDRVFIGNVHEQRHGFSAGSGDLLSDGDDFLFSSRGYGDGGSRLRQELRRGGTDTPSSAGYERYLTFVYSDGLFHTCMIAGVSIRRGL